MRSEDEIRYAKQNLTQTLATVKNIINTKEVEAFRNALEWVLQEDNQ